MLFTPYLDLGMSTCFPEVKRRGHSNEKPWITIHIKSLVKKRQKAFSCGQDREWHELRNKVQHEVEKAKKAYHTSRICGLQRSEPRKWHTEIKKGN